MQKGQGTPLEHQIRKTGYKKLLWESSQPCKRVRYADVMKMVNTFLKISLSKMSPRDPEPFHPTITIAYKRQEQV